MFIDTWGSTADERSAAFACDAHVPAAETELFRAVTVEAEPDTVFRWLCQLRVAPYSYDWIDNWGRRSPRALTPGLERLEVGQRFMTIFELVSFAPGEHVTLLLTHPVAVRAFGALAVTYRVIPTGARRCRLVAKLRVRSGDGLFARLRARLLAAGDLVMMRKQLLTLKRLAERAAA